MFGMPEASHVWKEEYANQIEAILKNCFILWNIWSFLKVFKSKIEFAGSYWYSSYWYSDSFGYDQKC